MQPNPLTRAGEYAFDGTDYVTDDEFGGDVILRNVEPAPPTTDMIAHPPLPRQGITLIRNLLVCSIACHCIVALLLCAVFIAAASFNVPRLIEDVAMATETLPVIIEHMASLESQIGNVTDIGTKLLNLAQTFGYL